MESRKPCDMQNMTDTWDTADVRNTAGADTRNMANTWDRADVRNTAGADTRDTADNLQALQKRARLRCMHLLEKRDYTEKQLRDKLRAGKTEYPPQIIDDALNYVKGYHYVDDGRYACRYVECMKTRKSRRQIEQELYQRGVSKELAEAAFSQTEDVPEEELIDAWIRKRRFDSATADIKERQRMYAFLARKGFSAAAISRALNVS